MKGSSLNAGGKRFQTASLTASLTALGAFIAVDWWLPATGSQLDASAVSPRAVVGVETVVRVLGHRNSPQSW